MSGASARADVTPSVSSALPPGKVAAPANTIWLMPDVEVEQKIIRLYLRTRYAVTEKSTTEPPAGWIPRDNIVSQFNMNAVPHVPGLGIVILVRKARDEDHPISPTAHFVIDQRGERVREDLPPEKFVDEVVESQRFAISDMVKIVPGQIFRPMEIDMRHMIDVLADAAFPYRIFAQNKPDFMLRLEWGS